MVLSTRYRAFLEQSWRQGYSLEAYKNVFTATVEGVLDNLYILCGQGAPYRLFQPAYFACRMSSLIRGSKR